MSRFFRPQVKLNEQKENHRNDYEHFFHGMQTCFFLDRDWYHVFRKHMGKQRGI